MRNLKIKIAVSFLLVILLSILLVSGLVLWSAPSGKIAKITEWNFLGLEKETLKTIHFYIGIVFSVIALIHLFLNFKLLINEVKCVFKR